MEYRWLSYSLSERQATMLFTRWNTGGYVIPLHGDVQVAFAWWITGGYVIHQAKYRWLCHSPGEIQVLSYFMVKDRWLSHLPGERQGCVLQLSASALVPAQSAARPGWLLSHFRERTLSPPSHDAEHLDQEDQSVHWPLASTELVDIIIIISKTGSKYAAR